MSLTDKIWKDADLLHKERAKLNTSVIEVEDIKKHVQRIKEKMDMITENGMINPLIMRGLIDKEFGEKLI